jgi:hypothetical protein
LVREIVQNARAEYYLQRAILARLLEQPKRRRGKLTVFWALF